MVATYKANQNEQEQVSRFKISLLHKLQFESWLSLLSNTYEQYLARSLLAIAYKEFWSQQIESRSSFCSNTYEQYFA